MTVPGNLSSPLLATAAAAAASGGITKSVRFNSSDQTYLNRTPSSAGNRRTWTWSAWVKRTKLDERVALFTAATDNTEILFEPDNVLRIYFFPGSYAGHTKTVATFRDLAAWYHIVFAIDTTQTGNDNIAKIYVNGVQQAVTHPNNWTQNGETNVNNTVAHYIGSRYGPGRLINAYMTDVYLIDGQQLDCTSFGEFDDNGVWRPKTYSGTFGTNGFHLKFNDVSSAAALGTDSSGNSNTFTVNNLTHAAGVLASGGKSEAVSFDGSDDSLNYSSDTDLNPGTGNFTVECFVYRHAEQISFYYGQNTGDLGLRVSGNGALGVERRNVAFDLSGSAGDVPNNQWSHVAVTRHSGTIRVYVNGSLKRSSSNTQNYTGTFSSGKTPDAFDKGAVASLHFVKGTALYTGTSYTVPTTISSHSDTKLLCCQSSSSATAATVKPSGVTISTSGSPTAGPFPQTEGKDVDVLFDVPTNGAQSDTGAGGEVSGNYPTFNPLMYQSTSAMTNGNLDIAPGGGSYGTAEATVGVSSGKWFWEVTVNTATTSAFIGIRKPSDSLSTFVGNTANSYSYSSSNKWNNGNNVSYGASFGAGDVIGVALDLDNGNLVFYKNGSSQGTAYTGLSGTFMPAISEGGGGNVTLSINFGQRAFANNAPANHKCINTTNLPTPTIAKGSTNFNTKLWTGTAQSHAITGYGFSPDFAWIKARNNTASHALLDTVRGNSNVLRTDNSNAEVTSNTSVWTSFDSDGFTLGADNNNGWTNYNNWTYVGWAWNAGANSNKTYTVKVVSDAGNNKYRIDNHATSAVTLDLAEGSTYIFDQSDSSNSGHPIRFGTSANGTDYTTGVTHTGTPGSAGAKTTLVLGTGVSTLYYSCANHSGMGGQINTNSTAGSTRLSNSLTSTLYRQDEVYSNGFSPTPSVGGTKERAFNGVIGSQGGYMNGGGTWTPSSAITYYDKVEVYDGIDQKYGVNGGTQSAIALNQWVTIASTTNPSGATLSSISMTRISDASTTHTFAGLKIDGKLLVDSNVDATTPTINSVVKVNPEAGFSVGKYTGNSTSDATVAHSLGAKPDLIIVKAMNKQDNWVTYHSAMGADYHGDMNLSGGFNSGGSKFAGVEPTSSVFSLATDPAVNGSSYNYIFYAFAAVPGYSGFGSYEGNGNADGAFVYTGFRPAMVMVKNADGSGHWVIMDTTRDIDNPMEDRIKIDAGDAESNTPAWDALSNGFKIRSTYGFTNTNGNTYVYWAMASNPFQANGGLAR